MKTLVITGFGKTLRKKDDLLVVETHEKGDHHGPPVIVSPLDLDLIIIEGDHSLTTGATRILFEHSIECLICDHYGLPLGALIPLKKSPIIENAEIQKNLSSKISLKIAKEIVTGAIGNKIAIFAQSIHEGNMDVEPYHASLIQERKTVSSAESVQSLLGIEGSAARIYFEGFARLIPDNLGFHGRTHHPPRDGINAMLSYGYGILYSRIRTAILSVRLSPYYGVLHSDYKKQEALVYDLIEEFRQPVVDRTVLTMVHRHQVSPDSFLINNDGCLIESSFKHEFIEAVLSRLNHEVNYQDGKVSLTKVIQGQAETISNAILKREEYIGFTSW